MSDRNRTCSSLSPCGNLDRADIGVRDAQILGLAAGEAAQEVRVAEEAGRRMSPQFRGLLRIGIGPLTTGKVAALAEEALATGDGERDDDPIPHLQLADAATDLDDLSHRLVAQHVAALHAGNDAIVDVQVRAADRAAGDADDGVARILYRRIWHGLAPHVTFAMPGQRSHGLDLRLHPAMQRPLWANVLYGLSPIASVTAEGAKRRIACAVGDPL